MRKFLTVVIISFVVAFTLLSIYYVGYDNGYEEGLSQPCLTSKGFQYGKGSYAYNVTGLPDGTTYQYRSFSFNSENYTDNFTENATWYWKEDR